MSKEHGRTTALKAEDYRQLDDERILVTVRLSGRGKASGLEVAQTGSTAATFSLFAGVTFARSSSIGTETEPSPTSAWRSRRCRRRTWRSCGRPISRLRAKDSLLHRGRGRRPEGRCASVSDGAGERFAMNTSHCCAGEFQKRAGSVNPQARVPAGSPARSARRATAGSRSVALTARPPSRRRSRRGPLPRGDDGTSLRRPPPPPTPTRRGRR